MKFINFGVKRSCFWYVTDFMERMLEVWNKYIDSMCAITFNTMNLLDHTCCTFIVNFLDMLESLLNANVLTETSHQVRWNKFKLLFFIPFYSKPAQIQKRKRHAALTWPSNPVDKNITFAKRCEGTCFYPPHFVWKSWWRTQAFHPPNDFHW